MTTSSRQDHAQFEASPQMDSGEVLSTQPEAVRAQAFKRFTVIRPFLQDGVPLLTLARHHGIPPRTAQRWVQQYRQGGLAALCRKPRADGGSRRVLSPALVQVVEALALQRPPLSAATIFRKVAEIAAQQGVSIPSYDVVHDIVGHLDPALVTLAHEGSKVYSDAFDLLYRREAKAPNDIWQADHTLLDIVLQDDKGHAKKPWLTVIMDDYSRAVAGYMLTFDAPSALNTALALRQAIWRKTEPSWQVCGIPGVLYTDHGSDFTSQHLEQVCADLKIRPIFSQVGQPRGRGRIERFFNTVNQLLLSRLPGYAPAGCATTITPVLDLQGFGRAFERFVLHEYHQTPHSTTGIAPQARWHAGGFLPQMPLSLEQLDLLLLTVARPRTIHRDGIRFQGLRYIDVTLAAYVGERVTVRYDPRDVAEIRVYYRHRFLCRAVCQELAGETASLKAIIRARRRRKRDLQQQLDRRQSFVDQLIVSSVLLPPGLESISSATPPKHIRPKLKRYENE
jgi:putative transposase